MILLRCLLLLAFALTGCSTTLVVPEKPKPFNAPACDERVYNRGKPPAQFLKDLYEFVASHKEDALLVGQNAEPMDAFGYLWSELKMSKDLSMKARAARLYELMRVSAAMESSWDWTEGRDKAASNFDYYTREAGIFQTSPNSHVYYRNGYKRWAFLDNLMLAHGISKPRQGNPDNKKWNAFMKDYSNKDTILKHHAFMVRHYYRHYGPIINKSLVGANLNHECIKQIEENL